MYSTIASATPSEIDRRIKSGEDLLLIDVREPAEVAIAALPGALVCPLSRSESWISQIPVGRSLVIFCHHGVRSLHAALALKERGHDDVINMTGGIDLWSAEVDSEIPRY